MRFNYLLSWIMNFLYLIFGKIFVIKFLLKNIQKQSLSISHKKLKLVMKYTVYFHPFFLLSFTNFEIVSELSQETTRFAVLNIHCHLKELANLNIGIICP